MVDTTKVILAKRETTYGVDALPVVGTDAVVTRNFSRKPLQMDTLERNLDLPTRGRSRSAQSNARGTDSYELELAGSGTAGTAPAWMEHLRACGMDAPVLAAGTKADQSFAAIGSPLASMTQKSYQGNQLVALLGARGTFGLDFTAGAFPFASVQMTGIVPATVVADGTAGTPVTTQWRDPVEVNTANTSFTLGGFACVLQSLQLQVNADINIRNLVGANYVMRGNHGVTGTIRIEAPTIAQMNYYAPLRTGAEIALALTHGTVAGNIVQLASSYVQLLDITEAEDQGVLMLELSVALNIRNGQDDLLLTAR